MTNILILSMIETDKLLLLSPIETYKCLSMSIIHKIEKFAIFCQIYHFFLPFLLYLHNFV